MRSLPKIFKDIDVVLENNYLMPKDETQERAVSETPKTVPYDKSLKKNAEILWQARLKAQKIIENANGSAKKIIQNANQKAQSELERAQKAGYEKGFALGKENAEAQVKEVVDELLQLIGSIDEAKSDILCQYENQLKDLALHIAKKIIDTELKKNDSLFLSLYKNAIKQHNEQKWLKLTVSQYEAEFATSNPDLLLSLAKGAQDIKITVAKNAPQGTCIVETPLSITDASVETQIIKLENAFHNAEVSL